MEILITDRQRLVKINPQRIKRLLRKALKLLASEGISGKSKKKLFYTLFLRQKNIEISILFVNDKKMRDINLQYRGKDKVTDVISFLQYENPENISGIKQQMPLFLGDIVVNLHQAKRQAIQNKTKIYDEVSRLLFHGLLHLLGYDHEKNAYQARKMAVAEMRLLTLFRNQSG